MGAARDVSKLKAFVSCVVDHERVARNSSAGVKPERGDVSDQSRVTLPLLHLYAQRRRCNRCVARVVEHDAYDELVAWFRNEVARLVRAPRRCCISNGDKRSAS